MSLTRQEHLVRFYSTPTNSKQLARSESIAQTICPALSCPLNRPNPECRYEQSTFPCSRCAELRDGDPLAVTSLSIAAILNYCWRRAPNKHLNSPLLTNFCNVQGPNYCASGAAAPALSRLIRKPHCSPSTLSLRARRRQFGYSPGTPCAVNLPTAYALC